jgi:hypothetical protein
MARTRTRSSRTPALAFDALTVEGALIAPAMLARIAAHQAGGQSEADYGIPKGLTLRDEIARYFRIGQALFSELTASPTPSQDWLNAQDGALWGLASNGVTLRLTRDNASLTRPAYVEADLRRVFEGEDFADFTALWLLVHASRFGTVGTPPSDCPLERWRDAGQKEGVAARDKLRGGVEAALLCLGNGFLATPTTLPCASASCQACCRCRNTSASSCTSSTA